MCHKAFSGVLSLILTRINGKNTRKKPPQWTVCGADNRIRTGDLFLTKEVLYLLSHISIVSKLAKNAQILTVFNSLLIWTIGIDGVLTKAVRYRLCHISASNGLALLLLRLTRSPSSIGCGGRI